MAIDTSCPSDNPRFANADSMAAEQRKLCQLMYGSQVAIIGYDMRVRIASEALAKFQKVDMHKVSQNKSWASSHVQLSGTSGIVTNASKNSEVHVLSQKPTMRVNQNIAQKSIMHFENRPWGDKPSAAFAHFRNIDLFGEAIPIRSSVRDSFQSFGNIHGLNSICFYAFYDALQ